MPSLSVYRVAVLLWALTVVSAAAAAPDQIVLNLEPTKENPRNSEGSFVALKSGRILFYYTQFYGGQADNSPARIVSIESDDAGRTWSASPKVVVENQGHENVMSVSLLRMQSGRIALFYLLKNNWLDCRPQVQFSDDEARTWTAPKLVLEAPGYFVLNNDRVIQLQSGRLVMPLACHRSKGGDPKSSKSFDGRAYDLWLLSDDEGRTWREADSWWALPVASRTGLQEPGVVALADGTLFTWARTDQGVQYEMRSTDAGKTWSAPVPGALHSPASPASLKRWPGSGDLLALYNDHSGTFPFTKSKRTPLVAALSSDGGRTWPVRKVLEDDLESWYCYTAIHFTPDAVLLAYCAGDSKVGALNRLRIRRVPLEWMKGKE